MVQILYNKDNETYFKYGNWYVDLVALSKIDSGERNIIVHLLS